MPPAERASPAAFVIVGGGFAGALLALKLAGARPDARVRLVERASRVGAGLAYGACDPGHLLNVPVGRMECGLAPSFAVWLEGCGADLDEALAESGGRLEDAFVPRALFGRYMEERLAEAVGPVGGSGVERVQGEALGALEAPRRGVVLADGREVEGDAVILATGNPAPHPGATAALHPASPSLQVIDDPWAAGALDRLAPDAGVLLVGTGLTMADIALRLVWSGHRGPITAVSRRGLAPQRHAPGGAWDGFLAAAAPAGARAALRLLRREAAAAEAAGTPWQRVLDAARPDVAQVWRSWSLGERARFLRHLRTFWDVHRHRMAPRVADALKALAAQGRLTVAAGRIVSAEPAAEGGGALVRVRGRDGRERTLGPVACAVNCTGPRSDYDRMEAPPFGRLRRAGLARGDDLRLGLETRSGAVVGADGEPSSWLHAVGGLTRPAHWEITAAPEIAAQIDGLVARFS